MASDPDAVWKPGYDGPLPPAAPPVDWDEWQSEHVPERVGPAGDRAAVPPVDASPLGTVPPTITIAPGTQSFTSIAPPRRRSPMVIGTVALGVVVAILATVGLVVVRSSPDLAGDARVGAETVVEEPEPVFAPIDVEPAPSEGEPTETTPLVDFKKAAMATDWRRLPPDIDEVWASPITTVDLGEPSVWVRAVVGGALVASGQGDPMLEPLTTLSMYDVGDGRLRWTIEVEIAIDQIELIGDDLGVVLIRFGGNSGDVAAIEKTSGTERWRIDGQDAEEVAGAVAEYTVLPFTPLLARFPIEQHTEPTLLFDLTTGAEVGLLDGVVVADDRLGRWYTLRNSEVVEYDLRAGAVDGIVIGTVPEPAPNVVSVVDGRVVAVSGKSITASDPSGSIQSAWIKIGDDVPRLPTLVTLVRPMIGSAFLASGSGRIVGAELADHIVRPAWDRTGILTGLAPTVRGMLLVVSSRGGAALEVIDGSTGETIVALTMVPGIFDALEIVPNGVVARRISPDGPRLAGLDLDGQEVWSLDGTAPASVGAGVVLRVETDDDGWRLVAYGDPSSWPV